MEGKTEIGSGQDALGHGTPKTYEELRAVLSSGASSLPKRLRQAAIFMWQHPTSVALGSINSVAEQVGVQPSTLVRFAQACGYAGFSDLQEIFKDHLKAMLPANEQHSNAATSIEQAPCEGSPYISGLVRAGQESLARIEKDFNEQAFEETISVLANAKMIYIVGSKRAFPIAMYMSLTMSQQGIKNVLVTNVGSAAFDHMGCLSTEDVVLAVSFSPYNSITPDLVAIAKDRGAQIVSITDSKFSPLVKLSRAYVEVVESNHAGFRSLSGTTVMSMAIVLGVTRARINSKDKGAKSGTAEGPVAGARPEHSG